jgi:hypothetical protein
MTTTGRPSRHSRLWLRSGAICEDVVDGAPWEPGSQLHFWPSFRWRCCQSLFWCSRLFYGLTTSGLRPPPARLRAFRAAAFWGLNRFDLLMRRGTSMSAHSARSTPQYASAWCGTSMPRAPHAALATRSWPAKEHLCKCAPIGPRTRSRRDPRQEIRAALHPLQLLGLRPQTIYRCTPDSCRLAAPP